MTDPHTPIETDALIIGAGPVGLFQAFELGLLEIGAHIVDSLPHPGGQCIELYPDKPIYDIPGLPESSGRDLTERLLQQIAPFKAPLHLGQVVTRLARQPDDGRFLAETSAGMRFLARAVFIAGGVGAFQARQLKVDGLERHEGRQVFYHPNDTAMFAGRRLLIVGGDDAALDAAVRFAEAQPAPAELRLLHRRNAFNAAPATVARVRALIAAGRLQFQVGQVTGLVEDAGQRLEAVQVTDVEGRTQPLPLDHLLLYLGLSPKLGPIADWGLALEKRQLPVDTERFQTSEPGIYAVGDVNTYPGKRKLIVCGFHEATLAAFAAAAHIDPQRRVLLQYTTTSPRLHQLLGVAPTAPADGGGTAASADS